MASSKASRRRQSRLTFTPLPSSSPATKGYPKQIQDRAATVGYDGSPNPAKRRKLQAPDDDLTAAQMDGVNDDLPTPAATMERNGDIIGDSEEEDDSEPIKSTQRRSSGHERLTSRKRSRQQQLDFSNPRSSDSFSSPVRLPSSSKPQSSARAGMFGTQTRRKQQATVDISSDESESADVLPSADKLMESSKAENSKQARRSGKTSKDRGRGMRSSQRPIIVESDEEEEDEEEDVDEDMPTTAGRQPRRKRERSRDSFISSSPPRAIDSDDDVQIIEKPTRRRSRRDQDEEDEEDDDVQATPGRRKLKQSRRLTQQEQDDLAEDLDDFGATSDVEALNATPRNTQSKQKSARQAALEKLKRKRSRQNVTVDNDDDREEAGDDFDELYDDDDDAPPPQPTSSRQMFQADDEDEDFIEEVEAGNGILGIPDGLPLEYTHYASKKASELFKHAIEWMVQKKINPAFQMKDEIYDLTFRKLDDEVKGLAGSKFVSAAWTPGFTMALKARPEIAFETIDRDTGEHWMRNKCDACNRSGHPATWQIQFQGKPYHPHTLEEVGGHDEEEDDDDSDAESSGDDNAEEDDADDRPAYDHQGRLIAAANTIYYVGKFCMANAETAHSLSHWRYHLNQWVIDWLNNNGYNTNEKIVQRDQWSTKKRRKYANKIADRMEKDGVVRELWRGFRQKIDEARSSKQGRFTAGDD